MLDPKNFQSASTMNGKLGAGKPGHVISATDTANFINFCSGKKLTNGSQNHNGSCNGIVMGEIPAKVNMVSTIITYPAPGEVLAPKTTFTVKINVRNFVPGSFTNPDTTYYSAPQMLKYGKVVGHVHIVIQKLGDDNWAATTAPDAMNFAFFKGINDAGDGNGNLQTEVGGGLDPGFYRVCTMASAANHQPALMPVAQRGALDDCTKFSVKKVGGGVDSC
jgi:transcription initiation factor TFIID subunit 15